MALKDEGKKGRMSLTFSFSTFVRGAVLLVGNSSTYHQTRLFPSPSLPLPIPLLVFLLSHVRARCLHSDSGFFTLTVFSLLFLMFMSDNVFNSIYHLTRCYLFTV